MSSTRSIAAGRAVGRWAWRLFRRDWRAQALVLTLTVVTVAAAVVGASMAVGSVPDPTGVFGRAGALVRVAGDAASIDSSIEAARQRFGDIEVIGQSSSAIPGSVERLLVLAQDPDGPLGAPMLEVRRGRVPQGAGEVALTVGAADALDAALGATVQIDRVPRTVVGIVENPYALHQRFAVVDPAGAPTPTAVVILVADPARRDPTGGGSIDGIQQLREQVDPGPIVLVVVVITIAMALVGLVAAAGFATIAQRRQRQLGLLAAIGGSRRHLGWAMVAGGVIVGVIGAVVGIALGLVAWQVVRASVVDSALRHIGPFDLPWGLVALVGVLAVLTSTAAAWWPARTASRIPVMAALSGRPVPPRPVHRPVLAGIAFTAGGAAAIYRSGATQAHVDEPLLVGGLLAVILGVVVVTPAVVGLVGRVARRLPLAGRIAVRDLSRHRARAAASLAAITLALGVTIGIVVVAAGNAAERSAGNLAADQLLIVYGADDGQAVPVVTAVDQPDQADLDGLAATVGAAIDGEPTVLALQRAVAGSGEWPIGAGHRVDANTVEIFGVVYVATPAVLAHYGIDPATIDPGTDLLTSDPRVDQIDDPASRTRDGTLPTEVLDQLPRTSSAPRTLVTEAALARHGWQAVPGAWLVQADHDISAAELGAARTAAARAGMVVESRSNDPADEVVTWTTRLGIALTTLILLVAVALLRADAAGDLRILGANGARPGTRRAIAAATAAALGLLGALLATAGTYVVTLATFHHDLARLWPVPWASLVAVLVGLPVLAAAVAWCTGGREPRAMGRRPLD